jgi:hypothetical protein
VSAAFTALAFAFVPLLRLHHKRPGEPVRAVGAGYGGVSQLALPCGQHRLVKMEKKKVVIPGRLAGPGPEAMNTYFCRYIDRLVFMVSGLAGGARAPE